MSIATRNHTLDFRRGPLIMGIVNVTPDSFSDGGELTNDTALLRQVETMVSQGADILDVGGESSRPFAEPVELAEELRRVIPAITLIRRHFTLPISVDTTKAEVARQALKAGADIINDISALRFDPEMLPLAVATNTPVIIMHMQGTPGTMQQAPHYDNVVTDIYQELSSWIERAEAQGLGRDKIIIDPGIGFGKTLEHNLTLLNHLDQFNGLGCPLLLGHSRKKFIGLLLDQDDPRQRDHGTAVISALAARHHVAILRVHNVGLTRDALTLARAISQA